MNLSEAIEDERQLGHHAIVMDVLAQLRPRVLRHTCRDGVCHTWTVAQDDPVRGEPNEWIEYVPAASGAIPGWPMPTAEALARAEPCECGHTRKLHEPQEGYLHWGCAHMACWCEAYDPKTIPHHLAFILGQVCCMGCDDHTTPSCSGNTVP